MLRVLSSLYILTIDEICPLKRLPMNLSYLPSFSFLLKKQRREVSINRPASYEPAALPLRHPAIHTIDRDDIVDPDVLLIHIKKLHHRESNPGHKRERLVCYQLHHNGFLCYFSLRPLDLTLSVYVYETLFPCWLFLYGAILFLSFFERFHGVVGYHITFT